MNVDAFLRRYFVALERRESARCVSMESRGGGTFEAAQAAEAAFAWASGLMGTLRREGRLTDDERAALRCYYLALTPTHVALVQAKRPGEGMRVTGAVTMRPGDAVPERAELQSFVSWSAMARALGCSARDAKDRWWAGREAVAAELARRYPEGDAA